MTLPCDQDAGESLSNAPPTTPGTTSAARIATSPRFPCHCADDGAVVTKPAVVARVNAAAPVRIFDVIVRLLLFASGWSPNSYVGHQAVKGKSVGQVLVPGPPITR